MCCLFGTDASLQLESWHLQSIQTNSGSSACTTHHHACSLDMHHNKTDDKASLPMMHNLTRGGWCTGSDIMTMLKRVTYTEKAAQLRPSSKHAAACSGDAQTECSICLENFALQEQLRRVGCGHLFHPRCIQEWFATGDTRCPMCRFDPCTKSWPR